jgi:hypothetical protein
LNVPTAAVAEPEPSADAGPGAKEVHLVFPGAGARGAWSGIPRGLARGLEELGVDAAHISADLPRALSLPLMLTLSAARIHRVPSGPRFRASRSAVREGSSELAVLRGLALRARLRRLGERRPTVQVGTGYAVPPGAPVVTLEDMTIAQAVELQVPEWRAQPEHCVRSRLALQRASYATAQACCVASDWAARSLTTDYGVPERKVHAVGLGRNHDPRPAPRDWTTPRFLFVGRDWNRKGGPELVRTFARLREQIPEATLDVVGTHPRLDLPGVRGHGSIGLSEPRGRDRLQALFENATCYVMPSRFEPFGIAHVEAAAAGVPSIGTTAGGAAYAIGPEGGRLVAPGDDEGLLAAMLELSNPDTARRAGAAALARSERFTWPAVAQRVLRALEGQGQPS